MKKKMLRQAFISSVMSLVLCCVMLIGTTFAWFTDSVTSRVQTIESSNLAVEVAVLNKNRRWTTVGDEDALQELFNNEIWEPGQTKYVPLRIANTGELPFTYQLTLEPIDSADTTDETALAKTGSARSASRSTNTDIHHWLETGYVQLHEIDKDMTEDELYDLIYDGSGFESVSDGIVIEGMLEGTKKVAKEADTENEADLMLLSVGVDEDVDEAETYTDISEDADYEIILVGIHMSEEAMDGVIINDTEQSMIFEVNFIATQLVDSDEDTDEIEIEEAGE